MPTIGGGGPIRPGGGVDAQKDASADALAETKKAVSEKIEQKLDTTRTVADAFQVKADAVLAPSAADLAKAQTQFSKEFAPEAVTYLETNLGVKMDPLKALKVKQQVQSDPVAKQALGTIKNAIEESNREFLAGWKPPVPAASDPGHAASKDVLLDKTKTADSSGTAQLNASASAKGKLEVTQKASEADKKLTEHAKPGAQPLDKKLTGANKLETPLQKQQQALKKEALDDLQKGALADQKKLDKTLLDSVKDPQNLKPGELKDPSQLDPSTLPLEVTEVGASLSVQLPLPGDLPPGDAPPPVAVPVPETTEAGAGQGGSGSPDSPMPQPTQPAWGAPGPLSPIQAKVAISFNELANRLDDADAAECALVVLMDAVTSVDKDIKAQQNLLQMRHKVNDAMRGYFKNFELKSRGLHGDQSMEWQNMSFDVGYDSAGNMIVTSFPDMTWATGSYDHVEGKGSHDITPTEGFQANTGANGMQEAQGNGSFHQVDDKTAVGLTSWRQVKQQTVAGEIDFIRSQISSIKQNNDLVSQELQKLMDLRKNILEQFGKIYQARSNAWDQQIALIAQ